MDIIECYVKELLVESGINFNAIPKEKILMTCREYNGIISETNYAAIVNAIEEIYDKNKLLEAIGM